MTTQQIGTEVIDKNGKVLGKIDYIIRNTWSGEVTKYIIYRKPPDTDLSFSPDDISETTESTITLNTILE